MGTMMFFSIVSPVSDFARLSVLDSQIMKPYF